MTLALLSLFIATSFAQDKTLPEKALDSVQRLNAPPPKKCDACDAKAALAKSQTPPDQPSDPVPYTCELEEMPRLEIEATHQNDSYLYGLKDVTDWKDGDDFGKPFELGLLGTYRWKDKQASAKYQKIMFSTRVFDENGKPISHTNAKGQPVKVGRQVDVDRIQLSYRKRFLAGLKGGGEFFIEGVIGAETRRRELGGAEKVQSFWHNVINTREHDYIGPEAVPSEKIAAEDLKEPIEKKALLWGGSAGLHKIYFKGKCTVDAKLGAQVMSDANRFISQNSNGYLTGNLKGSFGKKTKYEPILAQSLLVYGKSEANSARMGANTDVGVQVKFSAKNTQYEPFLLMSIPFGRQEFPEFNDHDKLMTMGLRVKFLGKTPK